MKMKRWISLLLTLALCFGLLPGTVLADETETTPTITASGTCGVNEALRWEISADGVLTISGSGAMDGDDREQWSNYCGDIKSLVVTDGVTSIGSIAFMGCTNLTAVSIGKDVTTIGAGAFSKCYSLPSFVIPDSVTAIGENAFYACSRLTAIVVSEGNQIYASVDGVLFNKVKTQLIAYPAGKMDTIYTIPNGVTFVRNDAFGLCTNLTSVIIPDSVTMIGTNAFFGCTGLTSVVIPDGVTSVLGGAFIACSRLISVTIPASVTFIGDYAFSGCVGLTAIVVSEGNQIYASVDGVLFNKDMTKLIIHPAGKSSTTYSIPNGVTSIGVESFGECKSLISVTIPESVRSIGERAFSDCTGLTSVTISAGVTTIGSGAFLCCSALKKVEFLGDAPTIGEDAFCGVTATAYYPADNATWTEGVMQDYGGTLTWESYLPGYEQMYVKTGNNSYGTVAEIEAGNSTDILFYSKTADDYTELNLTEKSDGSNGYVYTNDIDVACSNENLGKARVGKNGTNWIADDALPGAGGFFTVVNGNDKYAIKAKINGKPNVIYDDNGAYEFSKPAGTTFGFPPYIWADGAMKAITPDDYTFSCDEAVGSVAWDSVTGGGELSWSVANVTSTTTGKIYATKDGVTYSCDVTITVNGAGTGDNEGAGGESSETAELMYRYMSRNNNGQLFEDTKRRLVSASELNINYGNTETVKFYYGNSNGYVPATSVSVSEGSCLTVSSATTTDRNSTTYWELEGIDIGAATLSVAVGDQTYSVNVPVVLPDNGFYTSCTTLSKGTYLPDGFTYNGTNKTFYLVWNNSHSYIPANSNVTITYWDSSMSSLVSTAIVETGVTFKDSDTKRNAIKFTVADTIPDDFDFEVKFGLINRDGGTETSNWGIRITDNTPKLMYRYINWKNGQSFENTEQRLNPASELSISYGNTETVRFYYGNSDGYVPATSVTVASGNCIAVTEGTTTDGDSTTYWDLKGTDLGTATLSVSGGTGDNAFAVSSSWTVDLPLIGTYSDSTASKDKYCSIVEYTGETIQLYVLPNSSAVTITSVTANKGAASDYTTIDGNVVTISGDLTGNCNLSYQVFYKIGTSSSDVYVNVEFIGKSQGGNDAPQAEPDELISDARDLDERTDLYSENIPHTTLKDVLAPFTWNGEQYYLAAGMSGQKHPNSNHGMGITLELGEYQFKCFDAAIYVSLGNNEYGRVNDESVLRAITKAFGDTLHSKLYAMKSIPDGSLPNGYPAVYKTIDPEACLAPMTLKLGAEHDGMWLFEVSGTIAGQTVTSAVSLQWDVNTMIYFTPDSTDGDVITRVNEYLATLECPEDTFLRINLPEGEFYGYIKVPEKLKYTAVFITGADGLKSVLYGGVIVHNRRTYVEQIHFIGGGSGNGDKTWKEKNTAASVNDGMPNQAVYGEGGGTVSGSLIENYYCGVYMSGEYITGGRNTFRNNQTAICFDAISLGGGNSDMKNNMFENNGTALHFKSMHSKWALTWFEIAECCFVDNKTDVQNDLKRNIFIPGNYFAHTVNGTETLRECVYLPEANGNSERTVHHYPQAANRQFTEWIYDMDFYKFDPVVTSAYAAVYAIPVQHLKNTTITIMDGDKTLAQWQFGVED